MDLETLSKSPDWPKNLIGLPVIWRGIGEGVISSAEGRRAGGPIVSIKFEDGSSMHGLNEGEWDFKSDCKFNWQTGDWDLKEEDSPMTSTKFITLEELGLPVAADIEAMFWNTDNEEVCKAIESWIKTPDCSRASVNRLIKALNEYAED